MKYSINAQGAPAAIGPYSQGTTAGRLVFVSGQLPISAQSILAEAGCTLSDVAQTTLYLANLNDLDAVNKVYAQRFTTPAPARNVVEVSRLPLDALVEMDCIACR